MDESEAILVFADALSAKRAVEQDKLPFKVDKEERWRLGRDSNGVCRLSC